MTCLCSYYFLMYVRINIKLAFFHIFINDHALVRVETGHLNTKKKSALCLTHLFVSA